MPQEYIYILRLEMKTTRKWILPHISIVIYPTWKTNYYQ